MKTQLSKPARSKARYTEEYKQQALELWRASGRSAAKVAAELGIRPPLLYRWARQSVRQTIHHRDRSGSAAWKELERRSVACAPRNTKTFGATRSLKKISGHPLRSAAERYARIEAMSGQYKVAWLCEALFGFAQWLLRLGRAPTSAASTRGGKHSFTRVHPRGVVRSRQTYGSPRLAQGVGLPGRRNRIARLMRQERLFARQGSKYRPRTTDSTHGGPSAPNRLQHLIVRRSDHVWVTDATCILTGQRLALPRCGPGPLHSPHCGLGHAPDPSMLDLLSPLCAWRSSNAAPHDDLSSFTPIAARNLPAPLIGSSSLNMAWSLP